ncbi:MAG: hypothetical protein AB1726_02060 [Planctomycetota bacterium]
MSFSSRFPLSFRVTALGFLAGAGAPPQADLPFADSFAAEALAPGWTADVGPAGAITVANGELRIAAPMNAHAHVERALGIDPVRAECELGPGEGVSWAGSLFLYWDAGDWCQISVLEPDRRLYVVEAIGGVVSEHRLETRAPAEWHHVAIELAADGIRYETSDDGVLWRTARLARRPPPWRDRPPALLVVGKGYGRGETDQAYPRPDLDNDYADLGPSTLVRVHRVAVDRPAPPRARLTEAERDQLEANGRDVLGELELAAEGDPSFVSVSGHYPPLADPRESLGVKDGSLEAVVLADGTIAIGDARASFALGAVDRAAGEGERRPAKRLLSGHLPIVLAVWRHGPLEVEQTAFVWSAEMNAAASAFAYLRLRIANTSAEPWAAPVRLRVAAAGTEITAAVWTPAIPPGGEARVQARLPLDAPDAAREVVEEELEARLAACTASWNALLGQGMQIDVPEGRVNDAWRAWLAYNFIDVDRAGDRLEPHDGSGFYELVYGYSAALYCHALDLAGFPAEARAYLDSIARAVSPEGLYAENFGLPDTGALLFAMFEHYRLTGDREWLQSAAPAMQRMSEWIARTRQESMAGQPADSPVRGLIFFRPYCDRPAPAYSYFTDCYLVQGLQSAADAFQILGMDEPAARARTEAAAYRDDVFRSMRRAAIQVDEHTILPVFPASHELLRAVGYSARDYYSLIASCVLEPDVLGPEDEPATWLIDHLRREGGLILGMSEFAGGIDHAYTYGYWRQMLLRDEIERVILGFYGSLAYGMSRDTYSAVEVNHLKTGANDPTLPHLYSNTQQIRLLRNMLLREDGDRLLLAGATPRDWLQDGKRIRVAAAPTYFGPVGYEIDSRVSAGRIIARIDPPPSPPRGGIVLRLRHPRGLSLARANVRRAHVADLGTDTILLTEATGPIVVEAIYE